MDLAAILEEQIRRDFAEQFGQPPAARRDEIPENPMEPVEQRRPPGGRAAQPPRPANTRRQQPARPAAAPFAGIVSRTPVITPSVQAGVLERAASDVNNAIGDEMRSRVSQLREMRRMQHEKEIEMIRAQAALERVRQARMADEWSGSALGPGFVDLTGTAKRIG